MIKSIRLSYIQGTIDKIEKILCKQKVKVSFSPPNSLGRMLDHAKDKIYPKINKGVYLIPCDCGKVYIRETGFFAHTRIKEHSSNIIHERTKKSTLVEHSTSSKHYIYMEKTRVIVIIDHYSKRRVHEAIEIENTQII